MSISVVMRQRQRRDMRGFRRPPLRGACYRWQRRGRRPIGVQRGRAAPPRGGFVGGRAVVAEAIAINAAATAVAITFTIVKPKTNEVVAVIRFVVTIFMTMALRVSRKRRRGHPRVLRLAAIVRLLKQRRGDGAIDRPFGRISAHAAPRGNVERAVWAVDESG